MRIEETLGSKLRAAREERGWTQRQAGERVGLTKQAVMFYELGRWDLAHLPVVTACQFDALLGAGMINAAKREGQRRMAERGRR